MTINLSKFVHTETGKYIMSVLLGLGLASLFRAVCKGKNCKVFYAPPLEEFHDKVYKNSENKCVKFRPVPIKCDSNKKIVEFE